MKYANTIEDILLAFGPEPLTGDSITEFYYDGTMEPRTGDHFKLPLDDIYKDCTDGRSTQPHLLLGHRGCGKSTELNVLKNKLNEDGYKAKSIMCAFEMDLLSPATWDLLILIAESLLTIADEAGCSLDPNIIENIEKFWAESEEIKEMVKESKVSIEAEVRAPTPLKILLGIMARIKGELRLGATTRNIIRSHVEKRASNWISHISYITNQIAAKFDGKRPILIVEDVDKMNPEDVWDIFYNRASILSEMPFPIIYTFPISLSYKPQMGSLEGYFKQTTLPMIKIKDAAGGRYKSGWRAIREIVKKRCKLSLFLPKALDLMIEKTGGSLRDLFGVIANAGRRASLRKVKRIGMEDAKRALEELKTSLTRRIERKDYDFLRAIADGNKYQIEDKGELLDMMQASTVLEYNGERWHDVHPLVLDFLNEHVFGTAQP